MSHLLQNNRLVGILTTALLCSTLLLNTGCQNGMKEELEKLKEENAQLTSELDSLKQQQASAAAATAQAQQAQPPAAPAVSPQAFHDVGEDIPTATMINDLALLKVFEGMGPDFKPTQPITRGEYIIWAHNAYNAMRAPDKRIRMSPAFTVPFTDLKPTHPAYKYVQALANAGYSVGYEDKTFKPDKPITREEMVAIKHGIDGGEMYSNIATGFSDDAKIDPKYHNSVYSEEIFNKDGPKGNNIMRAFGPLKAFKPKDPVLRYEAAATIWQTDHRGRITCDTALGRTPKS